MGEQRAAWPSGHVVEAGGVAGAERRAPGLEAARPGGDEGASAGLEDPQGHDPRRGVARRIEGHDLLHGRVEPERRSQARAAAGGGASGDVVADEDDARLAGAEDVLERSVLAGGAGDGDGAGAQDREVRHARVEARPGEQGDAVSRRDPGGDQRLGHRADALEERPPGDTLEPVAAEVDGGAALRPRAAFEQPRDQVRAAPRSGRRALHPSFGPRVHGSPLLLAALARAGGRRGRRVQGAPETEVRVTAESAGRRRDPLPHAAMVASRS